MIKHLKYLRYVLIHKYWVFVHCIRLAFSLNYIIFQNPSLMFAFHLVWRGIIHDWHKFLPSEWFAYAAYSHGNPEAMEENRDAFNVAWCKHKNRGKHHWDYWIIFTKDGPKAINIPYVYILELVADWRGAGRAQGRGSKSEVIEWYNENKDNMILSNDTRYTVERLLGIGFFD